MSTANRIGPVVGMAQIRDAALAVCQTWLPDYLPDACVAHGLARDAIDAPKSWAKVADDVRKWPQSQLPYFEVGVPGTTGTPVMRADRTYTIEWPVTLGAIVAGLSADDTDLQASVYGAAMRQMFLQQATEMEGLKVESVALAAGEAYPPLPQKDNRYMVAPSVPFVVRIAQAANATRSILVPTGGDPGPYPTNASVEVTLEKLAVDA